jgi:uncharacterized membrane protein
MFTHEFSRRRLAMDAATARHTLLIALIILCGALLRLFMLTNQSLWFDEGLSLVVTDSKTLDGTLEALHARAGGDKYQPLYFLTLSSWRSLAGDSELALRILSVVPGIIALFFMYATVARIFGSRHSLWSTSFLAASAFWVCYSQEVRPYSMLFALSAVQLYLLSSIFSEPDEARPIRIGLFAVFTGICCFASVLLCAFIAALAVSHLFITRSTRQWIQWWAPAAIASVPALIYLMGTPAVGELSVDSTNGLGLPLYKNSLFAIYGVLVGHTFGPPLDALRETGNLASSLLQYSWQLAALTGIALVLLAGFVKVLRNGLTANQQTRNIRFFLVLLAGSFAIAVVVAKVSAINWMPRHSFYLSIPLAVLLPLTFLGARGVLNHSARFAFMALLAMNLYASYNYFYKSEYWRDDYRSAAGYLASHRNETDRSIMLWGEPRLLSYYGDTATLNRWEHSNPSPVSSMMDGVHSDGGNVFVAINREFTWSKSQPANENLQAQVAEKYNLVSVKRYVNFNIYEFENIDTSLTPSQARPDAKDAKLQSM